MNQFVHAFQCMVDERINRLQTDLISRLKRNQKIVVWGGGSKGVMFLNTFDEISYAVDINPRKQGKYIAGSGQMIMPPTFLKEYNADLVIIVNSTYEREIKQMVGDMGIMPDWMVV